MGLTMGLAAILAVKQLKRHQCRFPACDFDPEKEELFRERAASYRRQAQECYWIHPELSAAYYHLAEHIEAHFPENQQVEAIHG